MQVTLENVTHTYQPGSPFQATAIRNVNLEIREGDFLALIGHTGSGKSTLAQHINGLLRPTEGRVLLDGKDIHQKGYDKKEVRRKVGLVFQYPEHQLFEETVAKDVAFGPKNLGLSPEEVSERVTEALRRVGLGDPALAEKSPFELSGGQKRRVAIAGILAMHPQILVLDEPTAGLDPKGRDEILDLVSRLHEENKITVILVSHSMEDVANYVQRIIVMDHGCVRYDDAPAQVFAHYRELEGMGLATPQVTYVMHALAKDGWDVDTSVTTLEEAKDQILRCMADR